MLGAGEAVSGSADGTLRRLTEPLRRGDAYTVRTYAPTPTAAQMRAAPASYEPELSQYTDVVLPRRGENALDSRDGRGSLAARERVEVPMRSDDAERRRSPRSNASPARPTPARNDSPAA